MLKVQHTLGARACGFSCVCCGQTAKWTVACTNQHKVFDSCADHLDDVLTMASVVERDRTTDHRDSRYFIDVAIDLSDYKNMICTFANNGGKP